jgi:hypothetical protein
MSIAFTTGTINQPDAGSVGTAMVEKIRDDVVAHAAWELVEEFTPASGLVRWYVFKCLAASSGLSADYFVIIGRTLGNGELRAFICEQYNSTTHVATNWSMNSPTNTYAFDSLGRNPANYTLSTAVLTGSTNPIYVSWIPSGTSTKWWLTVDDDGFTAAFNGASNGVFHFGAYIPLAAMPILLPICGWTSPTTTFDMLTRNPAAANLNTKNGALLANGNGYNNVNALGFVSRLDQNDKLQGDLRSVAELGITLYTNVAADCSVYGSAIGKHKRVRMGTSNTAPAGFAFGDAYALQGRLWVPYLPTDSRVWDTGVAA